MGHPHIQQQPLLGRGLPVPLRLRAAQVRARPPGGDQRHVSYDGARCQPQQSAADPAVSRPVWSAVCAESEQLTARCPVTSGGVSLGLIGSAPSSQADTFIPRLIRETSPELEELQAEIEALRYVTTMVTWLQVYEDWHMTACQLQQK